MDIVREALRYLPSFSSQILHLCVWLALLTAIFAPLERLFAIHPKKLFRAALLTDLTYYFVSSLIPSLLLSAPLAVAAWVARGVMPGALLGTIAAWPVWLKVVVSLIVGDIGFYWGHRLSHEIPWLWRFHAIHHSAEEMDFLVNTRAHPVDMVFTRLCGLVPLYILGLAAPMRGSASWIPVLVLLFGISWGFFIHANLRWRFGVLEFLVATPAFHHWHHTNDDPSQQNKNFAPLMPWVDQLFGTMHLPKKEHPVRYGIDEKLPAGVWRQIAHPFLPEKQSTKEPAAEHVFAVSDKR
jgi:sterol desaturase/sphingolipid hydroxylase (fatty acid hydroxylase superfamily)